jgi:hypothetical protein
MRHRHGHTLAGTGSPLEELAAVIKPSKRVPKNSPLPLPHQLAGNNSSQGTGELPPRQKH